MAHSCTVYLRWADQNDRNVEVKFVGSKAKVNPIKGTTTPRAELAGAFILSRLAYTVEQALSDTEIGPRLTGKMLLTDSTTVNSWVKSAAIKYKPFVRNKIIEMQELHNSSVWRHIPRDKNDTADRVSKGCGKEGLRGIIEGPLFLYTPKEEWFKDDQDQAGVNKEEVDAEKLTEYVEMNVGPTTVESEEKEKISEIDPVIDIRKYSSWKKLINVTAYVYQFGLKKGEDGDSDRIPTISDEARKKAENYWIKQAQVNLPKDDQIEKLCPFDDENGIKRINGRISNSELFNYDQKHPNLLPKNHPVSELIVSNIHENTIRPGHQRVIAEVRLKYWVIGLQTLAKRIV